MLYVREQDGCPVGKKVLDICREFVVEGISTDWFETDVFFLSP